VIGTGNNYFSRSRSFGTKRPWVRIPRPRLMLLQSKSNRTAGVDAVASARLRRSYGTTKLFIESGVPK
jgi:hypothetical protein